MSALTFEDAARIARETLVVASPSIQLSPIEAAIYGTPARPRGRRASFDAEKFDAACERAKAACRAAIAACNEQVEISRAAVAAYEEALAGFSALAAQRGGHGR